MGTEMVGVEEVLSLTVAGGEDWSDVAVVSSDSVVVVNADRVMALVEDVGRELSVSWVRSVISITVSIETSAWETAAAKVEGVHLSTLMGSLDEERLGALGGFVRFDPNLLEERGGGALAADAISEVAWQAKTIMMDENQTFWCK